MKFNTFTLILSSILLCTLIILFGCEEQTVRRERLNPEWFNQPAFQQIKSSQYSAAPEPQRNITQNNRAPKIRFNAMSHDFGKIGLGTINNICEFTFTNVGNDNLIVTNVNTSCDCTVVMLEDDKKEYAPGESGKIFAGYTDTELGQAIKHIYVSTNDPENPKTELAIIAELVAPIYYEPKKITLSMIAENGDCPAIKIRSLDNKPFSITGFESDDNFITVKYNPNKKATEFVLEPKVDMVKLRATPEGRYRINLSHPDCKVVSGSYYTPPRFSISPRRIVVKNADPSKTIIKTINITSNYGESFDLNTTFTNHGVMKVSDSLKTPNGYRLTVEINPPAAKNGDKMFSENINLSLPGINTFTVQCNGFYPGAVVTLNEDDEECKTCGPVRLDKPSMSRHPR